LVQKSNTLGRGLVNYLVSGYLNNSHRGFNTQQAAETSYNQYLATMASLTHAGNGSNAANHPGSGRDGQIACHEQQAVCQRPATNERPAAHERNSAPEIQATCARQVAHERQSARERQAVQQPHGPASSISSNNHSQGNSTSDISSTSIKTTSTKMTAAGPSEDTLFVLTRGEQPGVYRTM
jgi:hypothetical protein